MSSPSSPSSSSSCVNVNVVQSVSVSSSTGISFGYASVIAAFFAFLVSLNEDCALYTTEAACNNLQHTKCVWNHTEGSDGAGLCVFSDFLSVNCSAFDGNPDGCGSLPDDCRYNYGGVDECVRQVGLTPLELGLYAGSLFCGGIFGPHIATLIREKFGFRVALRAMGGTALFSAALSTIGRLTNVLPLSIIAHFILGANCFACLTVGPLYPVHLAPNWSNVLGCMFQLSVVAGIILITLYVIAVRPGDFSSSNLNMEVRIHLLFLFVYLIGFILVMLSLVVRESPLFLANDQEARRKEETVKAGDDGQKKKVVSVGEEEEGTASKEEDAPPSAPAEDTTANLVDSYPSVSALQAIPYFLVGLALASGLALTGIPAIVAFAPLLVVGPTGLDPLVGTLLLSLVHFVGAAISPFPPRLLTPRPLYLMGMVFHCLSALAIGIATYPGLITSKAAASGIAITGFIVFVLAFNLFVGSIYPSLMAKIFPPAWIGAGSSFVNFSAAVLQLIVLVIFPITVQAFSGGPSGNQNKGFGIWFFIFAGFAAVLFVALLIFMHEHPDTADMLRRVGDAEDNKEAEEGDDGKQEGKEEQEEGVVAVASTTSNNDDNNSDHKTAPEKNNSAEQQEKEATNPLSGPPPATEGRRGEGVEEEDQEMTTTTPTAANDDESQAAESSSEGKAEEEGANAAADDDVAMEEL